VTYVSLNDYLPSTAQAWDAWHHLSRELLFADEKIRDRLIEFTKALDETYQYVRELDEWVSIFPGEDHHNADRASYVFDHLLPRLKSCAGLSRLAKESPPSGFIAILVLHCDAIGDEEGVLKAQNVLMNGGHPYVDKLSILARRYKGGRESGRSRQEENSKRNQNIRDHAKRLTSDGKPRQEIAGILAPIYDLSPHQIRRILKNPATN
jgi:hypothetical protein